MPVDVPRCELLTLTEALAAFVANATGHQGQAHIRPLHYYVACRLVVEGGFSPDEITPRPPFGVDRSAGRLRLLHDPSLAGAGERTVLGGLKTKAVDVVVTKPGIGPVLAVSMKGTLGAFRNLTNRMEEAIGDCTNLHISYPALVYGFFQVLRATRWQSEIPTNDICISREGAVVDAILRYHEVLSRLDGRRDLRDETTKYEAISLCLVEPEGIGRGSLLTNFPAADSPLCFSTFFERLYRAYDLRYVYSAPSLESVTKRSLWDLASPALTRPPPVDYSPRTE